MFRGKYTISRIMQLPAHIIVVKVFKVIITAFKNFFLNRRDLFKGSYCNVILRECRLFSYMHLDNGMLDRSDYFPALTKLYLHHYFDLLGSGWIQVKHGMPCRGLEGYSYDRNDQVKVDREGSWLGGRINASNKKESQLIIGLIDEGYIHIDWHLDFKSGYRWSEDTWYKNIHYGHKPGIDIKVPWELARMQHLPQLATAYALALEGEKGFQPPQLYWREFRNLVLDFIATNPPRFGVNWNCTMEVAIRVSNWLVAYDLFKAKGVVFDSGFEAILKRSCYEHGLHIVNNLEWYPGLRSNHYLSDIVGLLFVAAYLPRTPEIDTWLAFSVQELIDEVGTQFNPDGSNFEASTSYHRLSAELAVYATALVLGLSEDKKAALQEYNACLFRGEPTLRTAPIKLYPLKMDKILTPFPEWYIERLEKMAEFTVRLTKPSGRIVQIGDNDSGRFLKLHPQYRIITVAEAKVLYGNLKDYKAMPDDAIYIDAEYLDHRHLVAAINGLFKRQDFAVFSGGNSVDYQFIEHLAGGVCLSKVKSEITEPLSIGTENDWSCIKNKLELTPNKQRQVIEIPALGGNLRESLKLYTYPDFGVYIFRSERMFMSLRCGSVGQNGNGGHAHNDQLSIELNIDGKDLITDPGTYLYTPLPHRRNEYRSVKAHFAPHVRGLEPGKMDLGLFQLGDDAGAECLYFGQKGFVGFHSGYGHKVYRIVEVRCDCIIVSDYLCPDATTHVKCELLHPASYKPPGLSLGYGIISG